MSSISHKKITLLLFIIFGVLVIAYLNSSSTFGRIDGLFYRFNISTPTTTPAIYQQIGSKPCSSHNKNSELLRGLISHWDLFAKRNGIEYTITCGTLLGQYRNKAAIPWDWDLDVLVSIRYLPILNASSQVRNFTQSKDMDYHLVVQPEFNTKEENKRRRWNCEGKVVPSQQDACAFVGPMARLVYRSRYIDIYHLIDLGKVLHDFSEGEYYNRADMYPLVQCTFMNVSTWCPNNKKKILDTLYRNISKPSRVCKDGYWV